MPVNLECRPILFHSVPRSEGLQFGIVRHIHRPLLEQVDTLLDRGLDIDLVVNDADVTLRAIWMSSGEGVAESNVMFADDTAGYARDEHAAEERVEVVRREIG